MLAKNAKIIALCAILLYNCHIATAYAEINEKMMQLQQNLAQLAPSLHGSILTIAGKKYSFTYAAPSISNKSQFYIGSVSKQITAYMFLKALQAQDLGYELNGLLQRPLPALFPDSPLLKKINKPWLKEIKAVDLLTHRSGLTDFAAMYEHELKKPEALNQPIDLASMFRSVKYNATKEYAYSNTNYVLLSKLIEEMQCTNFAHVFTEFVQKPAHMFSSHVPIAGNYHALKTQTAFDKLVPNLNERIFMDFANVLGSGGIISTAEDMLRWNHYLYKAMKPDLRTIMLQNYGQDNEGDILHLGFTTSETDMGALTGFQGGLDSYKGFLGYLPEHDLNIVILSNDAAEFTQLMNALTQVL